MILIAIFVGVGVLLVCLSRTKGKENWRQADCLAGFGITFFVIACCLMIMYPIIYLDCASDIAKMESDYSVNYLLYMETAKMAKSYAPLLATEGFILSAENFQTANKIIDKITELRDAVSHYNRKLAKYRKFKTMWFCSFFIPEIPKSLDYLQFSIEDFK